MRNYRHITGEMHEILFIAMEIDRAGFTYRKDYDVCDAYSIYLDDRKCSHLIFANKRTYAALPAAQEKWNAKVAKDNKNARRRAAYAKRAA